MLQAQCRTLRCCQAHRPHAGVSGGPASQQTAGPAASGSVPTVPPSTIAATSTLHPASEWDSEDDTKEVTTVYIGNLPPEVDESILCVPFSGFGTINSVQVGAVLQKATNRSHDVEHCAVPFAVH